MRIYLSILWLTFAECVVYPSIPTHLLTCYRSGGPTVGAPRRLDVFLNILRTLEINNQLDMRLFSAALLRSLRLDGIEQAANPVETEFVTPFRASGFQFNKYKLLMDLFIPSQDLLDVDQLLSAGEKCLMHKMLSSSVNKWERGDESVTCPMSVEQRQNLGTNNTRRLISRCPIEEGVIQTHWGTIAPGTLVAAIAASLESQRVLISDVLNADVFKAGLAEPLMDATNGEWDVDIETLNTAKEIPHIANADISNIWVATLVGDLAEVAINQGPRVGSASLKMVIGSNNKWNDTLLPRDYYLFVQNETSVDWHFTDAEILTGIDGLILSQYIPTWVAQRGSLRMSQVIDMYYSNEGVAFEPAVKACNRQILFNKVFDRTVLLAEMKSFTQVLGLSQGTVYIQAEEMDRISEAVVAAFMNYFPNVLTQNHRECPSTLSSSSGPVIDLIVTTDGSWKGYDVEQFMSWIGDATEVGLERGSIALIHGNTGSWIAPPSDNLTALFNSINNFTDEWPNRLNFPNVISTIIQHSLNKTLRIAEIEASVAPSTMVLVVSPSNRLSANEVERARELMITLRNSYFDVYFGYVAQDFTSFENINNEYMDYSELFVKTDSTSVNDAIKAVNTEVIQNTIPKSIFGAHCDLNDTIFNQVPYEDIVFPNKENKYRIHSYYLSQQPSVSVTFRNNGHGTLLICWWRGVDTSHTCQTLDERQNFTFNITTPCPSVDFCPPAHFSVTAISSLNLCANNDCRLAQQVGYYMQHNGLRCLALRGSSMLLSSNTTLSFLLIFLIYLSL